MEKIRVLESVESLGIGGTEMFVMNFYRHIDKDKFQIDFLIYDNRDDFKEEVLAAGSKLYYCPQRQCGKIGKFLEDMGYVNKILANNKYDIIHCHGCSFLGILRGALPAKRRKGIRVISHSHSAGGKETKKIAKAEKNFLKFILSRTVDLGFACSDLAGKSKYTKKFLNGNRYAVIHNAIEIERYKFDQKNRMEIREKYNLADNLLIGNVGRLAKTKNQMQMLHIFANIYKCRPDARLMIVGGGELEEDLKNQAERLNLKEAVIFTGSVSDVERYYSAMDVFVMTSWFEGLPFTAIEAQANGLMCVFSDNITRMANITDEVDFVSLNESDQCWTEHILKRSEKRCPQEKLARVCQDYDLKKECLKLENYYQQLVICHE